MPKSALETMNNTNATQQPAASVTNASVKDNVNVANNEQTQQQEQLTEQINIPPSPTVINTEDNGHNNNNNGSSSDSDAVTVTHVVDSDAISHAAPKQETNNNHPTSPTSPNSEDNVTTHLNNNRHDNKHQQHQRRARSASRHAKHKPIHDLHEHQEHKATTTAQDVASGVKNYMRQRAYHLLSKDPYFKVLFKRIETADKLLQKQKENNNNNNNNNPNTVDTESCPVQCEQTQCPNASSCEATCQQTCKDNNIVNNNTKVVESNSHGVVDQQNASQAKEQQQTPEHHDDDMTTPPRLHNLIDGLFTQYEQQFDNLFNSFLTRYHHPLLGYRGDGRGDYEKYNQRDITQHQQNKQQEQANTAPGTTDNRQTQNTNNQQQSTTKDDQKEGSAIEFTTVADLIDDFLNNWSTSFFTKNAFPSPIPLPLITTAVTANPRPSALTHNNTKQTQQQQVVEKKNDNTQLTTPTNNNTSAETQQQSDVQTQKQHQQQLQRKSQVHKVFHSTTTFRGPDGKVHFQSVKGTNVNNNKNEKQYGDHEQSSPNEMVYTLQHGVIDPKDKQRNIQKITNLNATQLKEHLEYLPQLHHQHHIGRDDNDANGHHAITNDTQSIKNEKHNNTTTPTCSNNQHQEQMMKSPTGIIITPSTNKGKKNKNQHMNKQERIENINNEKTKEIIQQQQQQPTETQQHEHPQDVDNDQHNNDNGEDAPRPITIQGFFTPRQYQMISNMLDSFYDDNNNDDYEPWPQFNMFPTAPRIVPQQPRVYRAVPRHVMRFTSDPFDMMMPSSTYPQRFGTPFMSGFPPRTGVWRGNWPW